MRKVARALRERVAGIGLLATSPLTRAVQTAEIVGKEYRITPVVLGALAPSDDVEPCVRWLGEQSRDVVAIVGHEPHLGLVIARLTDTELELEKGGACLIEDGKIQWTLGPE